MKKILAVIGIISGLMILLLAGSGLYLSRIDPNKFKGRISQYVFAKSGQVLVINGDMHWSLFPWVGLKATNLTYYNPPEFTPKVFVSAKEMDIKVKLRPLINGKIEIGNITLDNAVLNLIKNPAGQYNWQNLTESSKKPVNPEPAMKSEAMNNMVIESLKIKNGQLNWYDQRKKSHTKILDLDINSQAIQFHKPFPLSLHFILLDKANKKDVALDLQGEINLSTDYKIYNIEELKIKGKYFLNDTSLDFNADGTLAADLQKQILAGNFSGNLDEVKGQLTLKGENLNNKPNFTGTITIDEFNLKSLLETLNKPISTKSSGALKSVALLARLELNDKALQLNHMHATVDKTDIFGSLKVASNSKQVNFNLTANELNLDNYLLESQKEKETTDSATKSAASKQAVGKSPPTAERNAASPWAINGKIKINRVNTDKLKLNNVATTLSMAKNIIRLDPFQASLYSGNLTASVVINNQLKKTTTIVIKESMKNVDVKQLLHEFSDADKLTGSMNINSNLSAVTDKNTSFLSALNGDIDFALANGSLRGIDVIYQLTRAHTFIKRLPAPDIHDSKETKFSALTATANVQNGVMNTQDLALTSEYLKVNGKGVTNLGTKEVKYYLNALAQPKLAAENNNIGKEVTIYQVPIKISGKMNKPSVNLDFVELAKIFYKKEIQKNITDKVNKKLDNLKTDLKDKMEEKIKDISPTKLLSKLIKPKEENPAQPNQ